jgi:hypothetical protein
MFVHVGKRVETKSASAGHVMRQESARDLTREDKEKTCEAREREERKKRC